MEPCPECNGVGYIRTPTGGGAYCPLCYEPSAPLARQTMAEARALLEHLRRREDQAERDWRHDA